MKFKDETGNVYGRLTVLKRAKNRKATNYYWECICTCGKKVEVYGTSLRTSNTSSCGCLGREISKIKNTVHGGRYDREYTVWASMLSRCRNPNSPGYCYYGSRGIKVCKRWYKYANFKKDMGKRPANMTLDRINTNGNYTPKNCRWATIQEQCGNRRSSRPITYMGETKTIKEWAKKFNIKLHSIYTRIYIGWSEIDAITTPIRQKRKKPLSILTKGHE